MWITAMKKEFGRWIFETADDSWIKKETVDVSSKALAQDVQHAITFVQALLQWSLLSPSRAILPLPRSQQWIK